MMAVCFGVGGGVGGRGYGSAFCCWDRGLVTEIEGFWGFGDEGCLFREGGWWLTSRGFGGKGCLFWSWGLVFGSKWGVGVLWVRVVCFRVGGWWLRVNGVSALGGDVLRM